MHRVRVAPARAIDEAEADAANWGPLGWREAAEKATPSAAEAARTSVALVRSGTLCTLLPSGAPFGTHVQYLVDESTGSPVVRIPSDSLDNLNLTRDSRCSLYIHPSGNNACDAVAQVTLEGKAVSLTDVREGIADQFAAEAEALAPHSRSYDDTLHDGDEVFELEVECAYVRRLAAMADAGAAQPADEPPQDRAMHVVGAEEYAAAACDPLAFVAPMLVAKWNEEHLEDVVRFCTHLTGW